MPTLFPGSDLSLQAADVSYAPPVINGLRCISKAIVPVSFVSMVTMCMAGI